MDHYPRDTRSPTLRLLAESSALLEITSLLALKRHLGRTLPRGDGHPVMLIPGFMVSEASMGLLLRALLKRSKGFFGSPSRGPRSAIFLEHVSLPSGLDAVLLQVLVHRQPLLP